MKNVKILLIGLSASLLCGNLWGSEEQESSLMLLAGQLTIFDALTRDNNRPFVRITKEEAKAILSNYLRKVKIALRDPQRFETFLKSVNGPGKSIMHKLGIIIKVKNIWERGALSSHLIVHPAFSFIFGDSDLRESLKPQVKEVQKAFWKCYREGKEFRETLQKAGLRRAPATNETVKREWGKYLKLKEEMFKDDPNMQDAWADFVAIVIEWVKEDIFDLNQCVRLELIFAGDHCISVAVPLNTMEDEWNLLDYRTHHFNEELREVFGLMGLVTIEDFSQHVDEPYWNEL